MTVMRWMVLVPIWGALLLLSGCPGEKTLVEAKAAAGGRMARILLADAPGGTGRTTVLTVTEGSEVRRQRLATWDADEKVPKHLLRWGPDAEGLIWRTEPDGSWHRVFFLGDALFVVPTDRSGTFEWKEALPFSKVATRILTGADGDRARELLDLLLELPPDDERVDLAFAHPRHLENWGRLLDPLGEEAPEARRKSRFEAVLEAGPRLLNKEIPKARAREWLKLIRETGEELNLAESRAAVRAFLKVLLADERLYDRPEEWGLVADGMLVLNLLGGGQAQRLVAELMTRSPPPRGEAFIRSFYLARRQGIWYWVRHNPPHVPVPGLLLLVPSRERRWSGDLPPAETEGGIDPITFDAMPYGVCVVWALYHVRMRGARKRLEAWKREVEKGELPISEDQRSRIRALIDGAIAQQGR